jgi:acyl-CoA reductase-like NAD-dependent aldehyde dehydrogenase
LQASVGNLKKVTLELGGKSPDIIFPDADMKYAIRGAMNAIFFNQGQVCTAGSRLFVQQSIYEQVVNGLADAANKMKLGPGIDQATDIGPLVSQEQLERVTGYIDAGKHEGATVTTGGERPNFDGELAQGYYLQPTVFDSVKDDMTIARDEIFGPVVVALPFEDIEEVAARANKSIYGLAAGVWTSDIKKAHRMAALLKSGVVWVNTYNQFDAAAPFGGYKQSGYGREMGHAVLDAYTQSKTVWINLR